MHQKLSTNILPDDLSAGLKGSFREFRLLAEDDPKNFEKKLKNTTNLMVLVGADNEFAPLPWLLARIAGAPWTDSSRKKWIHEFERYHYVLRQAQYRVVENSSNEFSIFRADYVEDCVNNGFRPSKGGKHSEADNRSFWVFSDLSDEIYPDELSVDADRRFVEGGLRSVYINKYERSAKARERCISFYRPVCQVCSLDFEARYGPIGKGFIHIHHLKPLNEIGDTYIVDPIEDLVPLCPNCHAMIHKLNDPSDIEALRKLLKG